MPYPNLPYRIFHVHVIDGESGVEGTWTTTAIDQADAEQQAWKQGYFIARIQEDEKEWADYSPVDFAIIEQLEHCEKVRDLAVEVGMRRPEMEAYLSDMQSRGLVEPLTQAEAFAASMPLDDLKEEAEYQGVSKSGGNLAIATRLIQECDPDDIGQLLDDLPFARATKKAMSTLRLWQEYVDSFKKPNKSFRNKVTRNRRKLKETDS